MPDNKDTTNTNANPAPKKAPKADLFGLVDKINEAQNVLIALSSDPSVDELATAIGLSIYLDRLGKRTTAIYSGSTPNALNFLEPEKTFEPTIDALQDFVIAINKDKADHLRYKVDGDFVKIFITPYKKRISEKDFEFSYGDFNVDLVLALDVANGIDLDSALREYGRIMHDATIINITTGKPGKFGGIEWSDTSASSVAEMVSQLIFSMRDKAPMKKEEATALLTGIVAVTNRFANTHTTPGALQVASRLMEAGANQQLVSSNLTSDLENEFFSVADTDFTSSAESSSPNSSADGTSLSISHEEPSADSSDSSAETSAESAKESSESTPTAESTPTDSAPAESTSVSEPSTTPSSTAPSSTPESAKEPSSGLMDELKAAEASLSMAGTEAVPEPSPQPLNVSTASAVKPELVLTPPVGVTAETVTSGNKYGQMLEAALNEPDVTEVPAATAPAEAPAEQFGIDGIPELDYMPMPDEGTLPPPPTPPIDFNSNPSADATSEVTSAPVAPAPEVPTTPEVPVATEVPVAPEASSAPEITPAPEAPVPPAEPPVDNPSAFRIPGIQ